MKIAVTGKGGVGKDHFCSNAGQVVCSRGQTGTCSRCGSGCESGSGLGFDEETLDSIVPISKMRKLVEERTGATAGNQFYHLNPKVDDIPETYGKVCNGVQLLVLGTVETGGGGCVCPEHVMLKRIINNLVLRQRRCSNSGYGSRPGTSRQRNHRRGGRIYRSDRTGCKKRSDIQECETSGKGSGSISGKGCCKQGTQRG